MRRIKSRQVCAQYQTKAVSHLDRNLLLALFEEGRSRRGKIFRPHDTDRKDRPRAHSHQCSSGCNGLAQKKNRIHFVAVVMVEDLEHSCRCSSLFSIMGRFCNASRTCFLFHRDAKGCLIYDFTVNLTMDSQTYCERQRINRVGWRRCLHHHRDPNIFPTVSPTHIQTTMNGLYS